MMRLLNLFYYARQYQIACPMTLIQQLTFLSGSYKTCEHEASEGLGESIRWHLCDGDVFHRDDLVLSLLASKMEWNIDVLPSEVVVIVDSQRDGQLIITKNGKPLHNCCIVVNFQKEISQPNFLFRCQGNMYSNSTDDVVITNFFLLFQEIGLPQSLKTQPFVNLQSLGLSTYDKLE